MPVSVSFLIPQVGKTMLPPQRFIADGITAIPTRSHEVSITSPAPCGSLGKSISGREVARLGLDVRRNYRACNKGHGTHGLVTCCVEFPLGCKDCPHYQAEA